MISIYLGNIGSGKTACAVRDIVLNRTYRKVYSNILVKKQKHTVPIKADMIVKKELTGYKKTKDGNEPVYEKKLNKEYWKNIKEPITCVLDEAHAIINSRRAMSKINIIVTDWLSLLRRVLGSSESGYGELVLITQLPNRIDIIAREMATQVRYHKCHFRKECKKCGTVWQEHSEIPEGLWECPSCNSPNIRKFNHVIEVWHFASMNHFNSWKEFGQRSYHKHYLVQDIEKYFKFYDTLQWDSLFSDVY